jgi:hypothetical protein
VFVAVAHATMRQATIIGRAASQQRNAMSRGMAA